jgi:hypothetical protein
MSFSESQARAMIEQDAQSHPVHAFKQLDVSGLEELLDGKLTEESQWHWRLTWANGDYWEFHRNTDWIHHMTVVSRNQQRRMDQLVAALPAYFRKLGITHFDCTPVDIPYVQSVGFQHSPEHGSYFLCSIEEGGRMDQYTAWKRGGPEPEWHARLIVE